MCKEDLLKQVQSYQFAAYDMLLFLDTHPDDKKAFDMYKELVKKYKALVNEYENQYGPLTAFGAAMYDTFKWIDSPWPWEREAN